MRAVNHHLLETLHIEMKAGRTFSKAFNAERNKIIFNQAAIDFMGLQNLTVKQVRVENEEFEIIGVTQNFHFASLKENKQQLKEDLAVRFCVYNKGLSLVG